MKEYVPNTREELIALSVSAVKGMLLAIGMIFNGYVIALFWGWFVVPVLTNIPSLPLVPAIGIATLIRCLTYQSPLAVKWEECTWGRAIARVIVEPILYPAMALFFGWIIHFFM